MTQSKDAKGRKSRAKVYQMWFWSCDECYHDCNDSYDSAEQAKIAAFTHNYHVHGVSFCPRSGLHPRGEKWCWLCEPVLNPILAQVSPSVTI